MCCSLHFSWSCRVVKTMSTVLLFFLNPHCDSGSIDSVMLLMSLRSITLARTLPATARSDMPLWLPQMALSPLFLNMVTMLASLHCCGMFSSAQTLVMYWCNVLVHRYPPCLSSSAGILSEPGDLLFFRVRTADRTSRKVGGWLRWSIGGNSGSSFKIVKSASEF